MTAPQGDPPGGAGDTPASYAELLVKVDAFWGRVDEAHPGALTCRSGCSSCCHKHLTLLPFEAARLVAAVAAAPEATREAVRARVDAPEPGADPRCWLLDEGGRCRAYAARPLICRTHGLPVQVTAPAAPPSESAGPAAASEGDEGWGDAGWGDVTKVRDVCPLNFPRGPSVDSLEAEVVLDLDRLNVVLGLVDRLAVGGDGSRVDLREALAAWFTAEPAASR